MTQFRKDIMSNQESLKSKLDEIEKGLYLMSLDRVRALSVHETVDLIEELRVVVRDAKKELESMA